MQYVEIDKIKPAAYNPRFLSDEAKERLMESLKTNGFCIPILVNEQNNVIIAGHQRTKAAKSIGITKVPCYFIKNITQSDEIRFNQLHNGTDNEEGCVCTCCKDLPKGFSIQPNTIFDVKNSCKSIAKEICRLITRYGNVLTLVMMGKSSIIGANYVYACKILGIDVNVSVLPDNSKGKYLMEQKYGKFSYKNLKRNTWVQGLAQLTRGTKDMTLPGRKRSMQGSVLYQKLVMPYLNEHPTESVLDFGCGKGFFIKRVKAKIRIGVEFYNNNHNVINVNMGNRQIDALIRYGKQFDVVVCDSVLNSIDSKKAQRSVLNCTNLFCKMGGLLFISGRNIQQLYNRVKAKTATAKWRSVEFLDDDGFSAIFRDGQWYYQKYHKKEEICAAVKNAGFDIVSYNEIGGSSWQIIAKKNKSLPTNDYEQAVDFEFNLPLPNGKSYQRNEEVKKVFLRNEGN